MPRSADAIPGPCEHWGAGDPHALGDLVAEQARTLNEKEGTSQVKRSGGGRMVMVSADGRGMVSHAGTALLIDGPPVRCLASEVTATLTGPLRRATQG